MIKRLLLTFGLLIAFFVSPVQASIFNTASSFPTEKTSNYFVYRSGAAPFGREFSDYKNGVITLCSEDYAQFFNHRLGTSSGEGQVNCLMDTEEGSSEKNFNSSYLYYVSSSVNSCPPDDNPTYTFGNDSDNDGEPNACYSPDELDNASNCAADVGQMLPAVSGIADKVCKTDPVTGASCGYSRDPNSGSPSYGLDLEMNCFGGDGEKVPEYEPEPEPTPDTCQKVNNGLMVCKEDPLEKCDVSGVCQDQCGFVNDLFVCYSQCSGAECDATEPPVVEPPEPPTPEFCEENPTHPDCIETPPPTPEFCEENPTHPDCIKEPDPDGDLSEVLTALGEIGDKLDKLFTYEGTMPSVEVDSTKFKDFFRPLIDDKHAQIETNKEELKTLLEESPLKLGTPSFTGGSYSSTNFTVSLGGTSTAVNFNLFEKLGANVAYIRGAILFAAVMLAAMIILSSGRSK